MLLQPVREWLREWALRRQGRDPDPVTLRRRRIYILPTPLGTGFGLMVLAMLLAAMNYSNSMAFAMTFLLAGLGLVTMHWTHQNLCGLVISGVRVTSTFAGEHAELQVTVENTSATERYEIGAVCGESKAAPRDMEPGERVRFELRLPAHHRGRLPAERVRLYTTFPFGLFRSWAWLHPDACGIVYPAPEVRAPAPPPGGTAGHDAVTDPHSGDDDFAGLRPFRPGDAPRRVAWKALARGGDLVVKQFAGQPAATAWLDFDSLTQTDPEQRLRILCRWVIDSHASGRAWGLRLPGEEIPPSSGLAHRHRCLTELALFPGGNGPAGLDHA